MEGRWLGSAWPWSPGLLPSARPFEPSWAHMLFPLVSGEASWKEAGTLGGGMWPMKLISQTLPHTYLQCSEVEIVAQVPKKSGGHCDRDDQLTIQRELASGRHPR